MNAVRCEALETRRLLSMSPVPRPAWNTGTGFFVSGNKVYDANGYEFIIKGPNQNQWWGNPSENLAAIDHVAKTGANAVRAVFNWADTSGGSDTPAERKTIVERYLANNIVPIVEDHATTNNTDHESPTALAAVVDHWLDPANVQWLQQYESKLMLNIANEWGPTTSVWRDSYITQVQRLRNAGINAMIVLDAGGWGQDINTIKNYAAAVQAADPQHNILFSIHFYSQWRTEDRSFELNSSTWDIATQLSTVQGMGLPILAGEFSWEGMDSAPYRTRRVLEIANNLGVGFMGWAWNNNSPATLNMLPGSTYQYNSNADITTWGDIFINDPTYGTKASALRATVFPAASPRLILEKTNVIVPETGQALARVRLNSAPLSNVTVNLTKIGGGDTNLNLAGAASLVFTPGNWDQYQSILLSASSDADSAAGTAKFQLAASGLTTTDIIAKELDANISTGNFTLNPTDDRDTQSTGDPSGVATTASASLFNTFLMKFSLANVGGQASSGTLRVYKNVVTSNLIGRAWIMLSDSWTQATAQASLPVKSYPLQSLTMPNGIGYVNFDVSSVINQELFGDRVITLAITTNSNNWTAFQTREGANQPQLLINTAEAVPPQVISSVFDYSTSPNRFTFTFNENVFASMSTADMQLQSLTDPSTVLTLSSPIDLGANTVSYSITPSIVPDGNYRATLLGAGVTDAAGNALLSDATINYFSLSGDANHDRHVDATDQSILTANFGQPGSFAQGDFNGDGTVNNADQTILTNQLNLWLPAQGPVNLPATGGADNYRLRAESNAVLDIYQDGSPTPTLRMYTGPVRGSVLTFQGGAGDDTLTLDHGNGALLPATSAMNYDGGADNDTLNVLGTSGGDNVIFSESGVSFGAITTAYANTERVTFDGAGGFDNLSISDGPSVIFTNTQRFNTLSLLAANLTVEPNIGLGIVMRAFSIGAGATLDLNNNSLISDYTGSSSLPVVQSLINAARTGGTWTGVGITSTTARNANPRNTTLAAMESSDFKSIYGDSAPFAGEAIDTTAVLVKYTYYGDTDFNGVVNFDDYSRTDSGFNNGRNGWLNGDFDGNGTVDFDDYSLIDLAFNTQAGPLVQVPDGGRARSSLRARP